MFTTLKEPKMIENFHGGKCVNSVLAKDIVCGAHHCLLLDKNGKIYTWGKSVQGQLGRKIEKKNLLPSPDLVHFHQNWNKFSHNSHIICTKICTGVNHCAVITDTHRLFMWGANEFGQLGDHSTTMRMKPKLILKNKLFRDVCCGQNHTIAMTNKRNVFCWGNNCWNQCQNEAKLKVSSKSNTKKKNKAKIGDIVKVPKMMMFEEADVGQQIRRIFAASHSTIIAVDTAMQILRVCV